MNQKKLTIGLFGFGVVGEGIYNVVQQAPSLNATIKKICIKNVAKKRAAPASLFTTDYNVLLKDEEINVIVELIDDAVEAFKIVTTALKSGKLVVSANKKMIAEHLSELLELQKQSGASFLYEAAVCGSVPIIRNLEEYYDNDLLQGLCGIVNGSTNFILTKISLEGMSYKQALAEAQQLGFAESNPALDVEGTDAANKLTILLLHAYGIVANPNYLLRKGITTINKEDSVFADEKGHRIKLVAQTSRLADGKVAAFVLPQFITPESQLYGVNNEYNGVILESNLADKQFLYGKGAGRYPTSSAVISDISALRYNYKYEYKKRSNGANYKLTDDYYLKVYVSFDNWEEVNKWDFESIEEFHSTQERQALIGVVHARNLANASWLHHPSVSVIVLPLGIIEKDAIVHKALKKISLQLGGV